MGTIVTNTYKGFSDHGDIVTPVSSDSVTENYLENRRQHEQRLPDGKFAPGNCGNPNGRPRGSGVVSDAIKEALREGKDVEVRDKLFGLMDDADRDSVRLAAISEIIDRSEGKAVQNVRHAGVFMVLAPGEEVLASAFGALPPSEDE